MFFPDRTAGYREALRVLNRDGVFAFNVWDRIEHNEFARMVTDAAGAIFPDNPPLFLERTPHGYHDVAEIDADLRQAGFTILEIATLEQRSIAPSARDPAIAYCQGTPLRNEIENRAPDALQTVTERAAEAIAATYGQGPVCEDPGARHRGDRCSRPRHIRAFDLGPRGVTYTCTNSDVTARVRANVTARQGIPSSDGALLREG
jgi:hypothetical protein